MTQDQPEHPYGQSPPPPPAYAPPGTPAPYGGSPQASGTMSQSDERLWGLLAHLSWIVGSIVVWRLRPRDGFVPPSYAQLVTRR